MSSVRNLKELCLESVASYLIFHSKKFQEAKNCEVLQDKYKLFQLLYSDDLLKKINAIHCRVLEAPETLAFADYLFSGEPWEGNIQDCLDFIFNEFSKILVAVCVHCEGENALPPEVISHILSKCEALITVDLSYSVLNQSEFLRALPNWRGVLKLHLCSTNCTDLMVFEIWDALDYLFDLSLFDCPEVSDMALLYLCENWRESSNILFCEQKGYCSEMGKQLKYLDIRETKVTIYGIVCALSHLRSLRKLQYDNCLPPQINSVESAIAEVNEQRITNGQPPLRLLLNSITCREHITPENLRTVLSVCPSPKDLSRYTSTENLGSITTCLRGTIKSVFLCFPSASILDSSYFKNFLTEGDKLDELIICLHDTLKIQQIVAVLEACPNLTKFGILNSSFDEPNHVLYNIPESVNKLQELTLDVQVMDQELTIDFFLRLITIAKDLSGLRMPLYVVNQILSRPQGILLDHFIFGIEESNENDSIVRFMSIQHNHH